MVSITACRAGDRGSIPRGGELYHLRLDVILQKSSINRNQAVYHNKSFKNQVPFRSLSLINHKYGKKFHLNCMLGLEFQKSPWGGELYHLRLDVILQKSSINRNQAVYHNKSFKNQVPFRSLYLINHKYGKKFHLNCMLGLEFQKNPNEYILFKIGKKSWQYGFYVMKFSC